jgi:hypothetical protein
MMLLPAHRTVDIRAGGPAGFCPMWNALSAAARSASFPSTVVSSRARSRTGVTVPAEIEHLEALAMDTGVAFGENEPVIREILCRSVLIRPSPRLSGSGSNDYVQFGVRLLFLGSVPERKWPEITRSSTTVA